MTKQEEMDKLFYIRCRDKRGEYTTPEENKFCQDMHMKWRTEYKQMDRKVFLATAPFGSNLKE